MQGQPDAAHAFACGETARGRVEALPALAAVGALPDTGPFATLDEVPRPARALPGGGVQHVGVGRINHQIDGAGVFVDEQHLLPGLAAVGSLVHAALLVGRIQVSEHGHPQGVGIIGMQHDATDVMALAEAHVLPRFAVVGALPDAGTRIARAAGVHLARAGPDDAPLPVYGNVAQRHHCLVVEQWREGDAVVHRLPQAARSISHVEMGGILFPYVNVGHAPAEHSRPDRFEGHLRHDGPGFERLALLVGFESGTRRRRRRLCLRPEGRCHQ